MKAAIYVRVSTQDQSCQMQEHDLMLYAKSMGFNVVKVYEDKATGTNSNRPALQDLFSDAAKKKFGVLLVYKLDRFARSLTHLVKALEQLQMLEIQFISLKDQIDLTSATGRLMAHLIGAFAEFEATLIKERVMAGLSNARRNGKRLGRPPTVNLATIIELKNNGMSLSAISKQLGVSKSSVSKSLTQHRLKKGLNKSEIIEV